MNFRMTVPIFAFASLGLVACSGGSPTEGGAGDAGETVAAAASGGGVNQGKAAFLQCGACHALTPESGAKVGPSLAGVVGRKAGSAADYQYSEAMAKSGIIWTSEELDAFITSPSAKVPGTKMVFAGIADAEKRKALIAYLANPEGTPAP
jgi:cytochrome c